MSDLYDKAYALAKAAHAGQVDKSGVDYIEHPVTVASFVETDTQKAVALLHDVLEDTDVTEDELRSLFGDEITDAVVTMTHPEGMPYMEYIARIAENPLARSVKMADLRHNMDLGRLRKVTERDLKRVREKYEPAMEYLKDHGC